MTETTEEQPPYPEFLVRVTAPHFCAGLIFSGPWCIQAAPIMNYAHGMKWSTFRRYARQRKWRVQVLANGGWQDG